MKNIELITILGSKTKINLFPKNKVEEIIQNIKIILSTIKSTVPLDRRFGISATFIDSPIPRAMAIMSIEILESIQEYEPRVEVHEIDFYSDSFSVMNGILYPKVTVSILDEYI